MGTAMWGMRRECAVLEIGVVSWVGRLKRMKNERANLEDAENQLRFLMHAMKGVKISCFLSLLKGSFSRWIWNELGILSSSIFPSVRCGLEMAILNAIANARGSSLLDILHSQTNEKDKYQSSMEVQLFAAC
ncbi:protein PHYLLO, chloroplastic-like [Neltuma alba]|uniref:protein PHYLLO, chloroplastic-like n=1 Tax=Neltuma alba TaxID=207710 RepID=UPI0010A32EB2|nr:protein PHYLLO, chloroplastic-like [Prosopis alba]